MMRLGGILAGNRHSDNGDFDEIKWNMDLESNSTLVIRFCFYVAKFCHKIPS